MAQNKDNNQKNDETVEMVGTLFKAVGLLVLGAIAALTLALARLQKELETSGATNRQIFFKKMELILKLAPLVIVLFLYLELKLPHTDSAGKSLALMIKTESDALNPRLLERKFVKVEAENNDLIATINYGKKEIDKGQAQFLIEQSLEKKEKIAAEMNQIGEELVPFLKEQEDKSGYLIGIGKRLQLARYHADEFLSPVKDLTWALWYRENPARQKDFLFMALLFLMISLGASYVAVFAMKEEDLNQRKGITNLAKVLLYAFYGLAYTSYIFTWPYYLWQRRSAKKETTHPQRMQLGHEANAYLTDRNLNYHTQIIGGSGAGKTNLLKVMLEDRIKKGHAVMFFDFKGESDLVDWVAGASEFYQRQDDMILMSMSDPKSSYAYNPIGLGSETEISSQLMNAFTWSESFYKNCAENALLIILKALCFQRDMNGAKFHIGDLYQFLTDPEKRMDVVSSVCQLNYPDLFRADLKRICEELSTNKKENYQSLITQISKVLNSSAGEVVAYKIGKDHEFNLKQAMSENKITYFLLNSLKLKDTAAIMGKLILQDLMKTVGNIYDDRGTRRNPVTIIIDEFASFATPDFGELIEKARGAGISIVVTYQSRKSLDHIEQSLALKMNENTANKVVFQVQDSEDVEWFCSLLGTKTTQKETHQAEDTFLGEMKTGKKSVREVEEYVVHPNQIKKLKFGQALLYASKVDTHHTIMNILKANEFSGRYERAPFVEQSKPVQRLTVRQSKPQETVEINDLI